MEIKELQEKIKKLKEERDQYDAMNNTLKQIGSACDSLEAEILSYFEENDMSSFRVDGVALISVTEKLSVKTPKTPEEKLAFFNYLKETKGDEVMLHYQTVNSVSLNSFYKAEMDTKSPEEKLCFNMPGIGAPTLVKKLSVRKA